MLVGRLAMRFVLALALLAGGSAVEAVVMPAPVVAGCTGTPTIELPPVVSGIDYSDDGRVTTMTEGSGGTLGFTYDNEGNLAKKTDTKYSALPPGNTAENLTVIRVPRGTTIYEGKAAAQPSWGWPGGGNQVVFGDGFHIPSDWIVR